MLTVKKGRYDRHQMESELEIVKKMLPSIESFDTFLLNNDVFDMQHNLVIKNLGKLISVFNEGLENRNRYRVIGKN